MTDYYIKGDTDGEYVKAELPTFHDRLPDDLREHEVVKGFSSEEDLAKAYLDLHSSRPQVPQDPAEYQVELPEGTPVDEEAVNNLRAQWHRLGFTQDQAKAFLAEALESHNTRAAQQRAAIEAAMEERFGKTQVEAARSAASEVLEKIVGKKEADDLRAAGVLNTPALVGFLQSLRTRLSERALVPGDFRPTGKRAADPKTGEAYLHYPSMD
jgi:hypothetical protein